MQAGREDNQGLVVKYDVRKVDSGELVQNCFVLRPEKDWAAVRALRKYADATKNERLAKEITDWLNLIVMKKTKDLKAFAIGPDRFDVIVGYDRQSVIDWYKQKRGISEQDWADYHVEDYDMDEHRRVDNEDGDGHDIITLRDFVVDVDQFPCVAWWTEY